jgi:hypothetical protein
MTDEEQAPEFVDENGNPRAPTNTDLLAVIKELEKKVDYLTTLVDDGYGCRYGNDY